MDHAQLVERAKSLIDDLAQTPRFAGSVEEARARAKCRAELEQAGYACREVPFEYSRWLGRWGPPLVALIAALLFILLGQFAMSGSPWPAITLAWLYVLLIWLNVAPTRHRWVLTYPWSRTTAFNLEATRGRPTVWLVAHLDSKSQTVPMLLRIFGSVSLQIGVLLTMVGALAVLIWGHAAVSALYVAQSFVALGALPVALCFVGNRSSGAVDNASGVAAAILAAQSKNAPESLGVLITSGEELGLAGALAWTRDAASGLIMLNCDTVDDSGSYRCMYTAAEPKRVTAAAENEAKAVGIPLTIGRMIPGIMADSMAFAYPDRWSAITLSRGTLSTLARIHTRGDNSTKLTGEGVAEASALLSAMARELS